MAFILQNERAFDAGTFGVSVRNVKTFHMSSPTEMVEMLSLVPEMPGFEEAIDRYMSAYELHHAADMPVSTRLWNDRVSVPSATGPFRPRSVSAWLPAWPTPAATTYPLTYNYCSHVSSLCLRPFSLCPALTHSDSREVQLLDLHRECWNRKCEVSGELDRLKKHECR